MAEPEEGPPLGLGTLDGGTTHPDGSMDAIAVPQGENVCERRGGSCILISGLTFCAAGHHIADRVAFPCAATQGPDVECCMLDEPSAPDAALDGGSISGELDGSTKPPRYVCEADGGYAGPSGMCPDSRYPTSLSDGGAPLRACAAGCMCTRSYADRFGPLITYCSCPPPPSPGACVNVNCGSINCFGGTNCVDPEQGICQ